HAEARERIDDGVDHRRRRADRTALAGALDADRVGLAGAAELVEMEARQIVGARHAVILEARREELSRLRIIGDVLDERLADPLGDAAMDLTLEEQRV